MSEQKSATNQTTKQQNGSNDAPVKNNDNTNNGNSVSTEGVSGVTPEQSGINTTASNEPIGFVGCSNIRDTVQGYQANGGKNFWVPDDNTYAGGTVTKWGNLSSEYWAQFDQFLAKYPTTKTIWWGLCTYSSDRESNSSNNSAAKVIVAELKKKIPGVTIYVSAINDFVAPHACRLTGGDGPSRMQTLANTIVNSQGLKPGPALGSIIYYNTDLNKYDPNSGYYTNSSGATSANNQTKPDGCHPNEAGELYLGKSLVNFFGS